jgi:hypothetical protein
MPTPKSGAPSHHHDSLSNHAWAGALPHDLIRSSHETTRKILTVAGAVAAGLIAFGGSAAAAPPPSDIISVDLPAADAAGNGFCPFPVHLEGVSHQRATTLETPEGVVVTSATGNATVVATNTETGKSISYQINGPGTFTTNPDGSFTIDAAGPNLLFTTVANSYQGFRSLPTRPAVCRSLWRAMASQPVTSSMDARRTSARPWLRAGAWPLRHPLIAADHNIRKYRA